jgi:four helix bundle protein
VNESAIWESRNLGIWEFGIWEFRVWEFRVWEFGVGAQFLPHDRIKKTAISASPASHVTDSLSISRGIAPASLESMTKEELQDRSLKFAAALRPISQRVRAQPDGRNAADQLLDCSSSMAANYRAACRGRSRAEFISKLGTVSEESDETVFWLQYIVECKFLPAPVVADFLDEARQLSAIFSASYGTARENRKRSLEDHRPSTKLTKLQNPQITK